jgi:Tol biopolymer transport system component
MPRKFWETRPMRGPLADLPIVSSVKSLVVAAADGSQDRVLTTGEIVGGSAVWSPTGDRIAIDGGNYPAQELSVVDVTSGRVTSLANTLGTEPLRGTESLHVIGFSPAGTGSSSRGGTRAT